MKTTIKFTFDYEAKEGMSHDDVQNILISSLSLWMPTNFHYGDIHINKLTATGLKKK